VGLPTKIIEEKNLRVAQVIQELISLAREIRNADRRRESLGLSSCKLAFYDAVANNESTRALLGDEILRQLAIYLVETVRSNASIDWTIKESVKARLKVMVKRALRKFGYPPDQEKLATETVLKQAELLAGEWVGG